MIKRILILTFVLLQILAFGRIQTIFPRHKIDSLQKLLPGTDIEQQVDILNALAAYYAPIHFDSSIMHSTQALRIGTIYGYPIGIGVARLNTGNAYYYKMDLKNALQSYLSALKILEENDPVKELGELYLQLGHINFFMERMDKSISFYQLAVDNYHATGSDQLIPEALWSICFTYLRDAPEKLDSVVNYGQKLLEYSKKLKDRTIEAYALDMLGMAYLGKSNLSDNQQKSFDYLNKSLEIATELKHEGLICVNNINLASYFAESPALPGATGYLPYVRSSYKNAYDAARRFGSVYLQAIILNYLAEFDLGERKYAKAEINLKLSESKLDTFFLSPKRFVPDGYWESFDQVFEFDYALRLRLDLYNLRFRLAMAQGQSDRAVDYLQAYYQNKDSLHAEQQVQQFELLMAEAEAEKTDQKIRSLAQDNELNQLRLLRTRYILGGIGAGMVIISLFLLLFFQRKRWKAEQKSANLEQKLLRSQMNPHFIFNSLASIQNFVINQKATEASIYLSRFSQLVRNILDSSVDENVLLQKEIETIQNYLELQKVRYAGQFEYTLNVDEKIDEETMMIPPMLAQPFIENSIEHGIKYKETPGHINIRFKMEGDIIRFEVEDDGVGRDKAKEIELKQKRIHRSMSTSITQERLIKLNKKLKHKIQMEITDLKDNMGVACGTKVTFGIPVVVK